MACSRPSFRSFLSDSCYNVLSKLYADNGRGTWKLGVGALKKCLADMLRTRPDLYHCRRSRRMPQFPGDCQNDNTLSRGIVFRALRSKPLPNRREWRGFVCPGYGWLHSNTLGGVSLYSGIYKRELKKSSLKPDAVRLRRTNTASQRPSRGRIKVFAST
jgi:hypothetical protein